MVTHAAFVTENLHKLGVMFISMSEVCFFFFFFAVTQGSIGPARVFLPAIGGCANLKC